LFLAVKLVVISAFSFA